MRTRILPDMLNDEVEEYLSRNDAVIVSLGSMEMHGGFPLDCENVISEAFAVKMAEECDALALTGLPYLYSGATAIGRGTVQVSIRSGIDYLYEIASSLLRQGFKRQIYISWHGPARLTALPVVRDFFEETGISIMYIDLMTKMMESGLSRQELDAAFHSITVGAYKLRKRLEAIPLTSDFSKVSESSLSRFQLLMKSGTMGYHYGAKTDHMPTPAILTEAERESMAENGISHINRMISDMNLKTLISDLKEFNDFQKTIQLKAPWVLSI